MKPKNYEVLMDIYMGVLNAPAIQFTTEDFGMCQITFSLLEDRITPYNLSNCIVRMVINGQQQDCTISDANNGKAEIVLLQSMFTEVGHVFAELQIYDATNQTMRLTTPTFKYTVRKSLMDDNTVQADANYSILQQMILNVSNADKVSSEALKLSKEAKAICDDLVPKANTAAQNAQTALDRAESVVTQEELAQKVTLDGNDTKFDFIKNQVVQNGLVALPTSIQDTEENGIVFMCSFVYDGVPFELFSHLSDGNASGWNLTMNSDSTLRLGIIIASGTYTGFRGSKVLKNGEHYEIICLKNGTDYKVYIDGILEIHRQTISVYSNVPYLTRYSSRFTNFLFYNRPLTPQEIQHNLSTFNNSPSIKKLRTTDSTGKTSILKLASDTDHVEDRAGRTQEQINRTFYKRMCKEMPSQNGEPITVKNGEEGYVLSAEIKGNTQLFKRAKGSQDEWIVIPNDEGRDTVAFEYKLDSTQAIISNNGEKYPIYATEEDKANKKVISLNKVGDMADTLEIKSDGSGVWTNHLKCEILTNELNYRKDGEGTNTVVFAVDFIGMRPNTILADKFVTNSKAWDTSANIRGVANSANSIFIQILKSELSSYDVQGFKEWLKTNTINVIYQLATPTVTHLDKSIVPAILTHKTNILEAGGAVKPSSFKVTVPVDKLAEIEARLQALESTTVDVVLNK